MTRHSPPLRVRLPLAMILSLAAASAWCATGLVHVASGKDNALTLVDARTLAVAGARLFVAGGLSNDLSAIDTASATIMKTIPVGQVPHAVLVDD